MKVILLLSMVVINIVVARTAEAGAATGMPSPFMPPYPDFGYRGQCPWHGEVGPWCPVMGRHTLARTHLSTGTTGKSRK
jgi:hypothetical protein